MMPEISLNILDVAQNSVKAGAKLVEITVVGDTTEGELSVVISDDGCGMTPEQVKQVTDPFFTTRTTRKVGLGVPFFKMAAEITGGRFSIESEPGKGTATTAVFKLDSIDKMPMGDLASTVSSIIGTNPDIDFVLTVENDGQKFQADTRQFKDVLGDISLGEPQVVEYIREFINSGMEEIHAVF